MSKSIALSILLSPALMLAGPMLVERQASDPPGSVLPTQTSYAPLGASDVPSVNRNGKFQWQVYGKCDNASKNAITQAWEDSKQFADAFSQWKPNGNFQPAVDMYMGTRSTYWDLFGYDFPTQIQNTISRLEGLYEQKSTYGNANLWVYCNEDSFWFPHCTQTDTSAIIAYETEDNFFNNWYITFCPAFFNTNYELSLAAKVQQIQAQDYNTAIMEAVAGPPGIQAGVFFHEVMHMSKVVTAPQARDSAYGPKLVYDLAKSRNTDAAVYNADSWTITAMAIWAQIKYSLTSPPIPFDYYTGAGAKSFGPGGNPLTGVIYVDAADVVPQGATAVPTGQGYNVDPSIWQVYTPGTGLAPLAGNSTAPSPSPSPTPTPSPTSSQPPAATDSCGDWYKFLFDSFQIYGKNFNSTTFGSDGSGLKGQIKGCGDLTDWHFETLTNNTNGYQWYAYGNLPIGTKACVGRAVVSAGGSSASGCTGAG